MPTALPSTRASAMPRVTGDSTACRRVAASSRTPALASPNAGMTTYADQGCSHSCSRSLGETVAAAASDVSLARAAEGLSTSARPKTYSSRVRTVSGEELGTSSPTSTPARVGCTPEAKVAAHKAIAEHDVRREPPDSQPAQQREQRQQQRGDEKRPGPDVPV